MPTTETCLQSWELFTFHKTVLSVDIPTIIEINSVVNVSAGILLPSTQIALMVPWKDRESLNPGIFILFVFYLIVE